MDFHESRDSDQDDSQVPYSICEIFTNLCFITTYDTKWNLPVKSGNNLGIFRYIPAYIVVTIRSKSQYGSYLIRLTVIAAKSRNQNMYFFSTNDRTEVSLFQASDSWSSGLRKLARKMLEGGREGGPKIRSTYFRVLLMFLRVFPYYPTAQNNG